MTTDRLSDGYEPRWDIDVEVGRQGELFVRDVQLSFATGSVEVKNDQKAATTGNVFIEWSCLKSKGWEKSGIATTEAEMWAWVIADTVIVSAPSKVVLAAARQAFREGRSVANPRGSHPTQGVLIPINQLITRLSEAAKKAA